MNDFPEAPASVTYSVTSPAGFPALFTVRETTGTALLEKMALIEQAFAHQGYKPQVKTYGQKQEVKYVEGRKCDKCESRLVEKHKKTGELYYKCEKGGWDKEANKATGCDFVDWLNKEAKTVQEFESNGGAPNLKW